jgi:hypothetical protein
MERNISLYVRVVRVHECYYDVLDDTSSSSPQLRIVC